MKLSVIAFVCLISISNIAFCKEINLLCNGLYSISGGISDQSNKEFNFSFDEKKRTFKADNILLCTDNTLPLIIKTGYFSKDEIIFSHTNDPNDPSKCTSSFKLSRHSGRLTFLQILGDNVLIYEGSFNCKISTPKF